MTDPNYQVTNEYDPIWPNDYHKVVQGNGELMGQIELIVVDVFETADYKLGLHESPGSCTVNYESCKCEAPRKTC